MRIHSELILDILDQSSLAAQCWFDELIYGYKVQAGNWANAGKVFNANINEQYYATRSIWRMHLCLRAARVSSIQQLH